MKETEILFFLLLLKREVLCEIFGLSSEECLSIQEYEFTLEGNKVEYLETWVNTKRTTGYRKWDVSTYNLQFPINLHNLIK